MTRKEQRQFVRSLQAAITKEVLAHITAGKVPEDWTGHELRYLLSRKHEESASMSNGVMTGKRLKDFKNTVLINYL